MSYGGRVTRSVSSTIALGKLGSSSSEIEFSDYGPFDVTLQYLKNGNIVQEDHQSIGISASEYNLAPLQCFFPRCSLFAIFLGYQYLFCWNDRSVNFNARSSKCL